jgi:hypothetical protein
MGEHGKVNEITVSHIGVIGDAHNAKNSRTAFSKASGASAGIE